MLGNFWGDIPEQEINFEELEQNDDEKIDNNINLLIENPDENVKKILKNIFSRLDISEELYSKAIQVYNEVEFKKHNSGIDALKIIFEEAARFSNFDINKRLIDFFNFLLSIINLDYSYIIKALQIRVKNLDKNNKKDILFFWKSSIIEQYLNAQGIKIQTKTSKNILKLLIEYNYNVSQIYNILDVFKDIINNNEDDNNFNKNNNFDQYEIINSLINTIISYPKSNLDELINFLKIRLFNNKNKGTFGFDSKIALDFYLKASSDQYNKDNNSLDLTKQELFSRLKILNSDISDNEIRKIDNQLKIIDSIISNPIYQNYNKEEFQEWTKNKFPLLRFDSINSDESIATVLGMISLVIKKERGYYLRNTQLIAVLMFIGKDKQYGLIEEISTGEGKSCIISALSIYFALRNHKVDIISSGYTLVKRDSDEFKNIYEYFNLTTAYPYDSEPGPYTCDILYGTFLEFEGDYLREITSDRNIRNERPYDVIIIDKVGNLFIDNILGSTRLTNSFKGFKFLAPYYFTTYLSVLLVDFAFKIKTKKNWNQLF